MPSEREQIEKLLKKNVVGGLARLEIERLIQQRVDAAVEARNVAWRTHLEECLAGRVEPDNPTMEMLDDWRDAAVQAERERCAKIAEQCNDPSTELGTEFCDGREDNLSTFIAAAIRSGERP